MAIKDVSFKIGNGRTGLLLIHGLGGTPSELRFVASALAREGLTIHCPQLAGHGGTDDDLKWSSWREWYASAERALEELSQVCDTVIVGGLSTGAILSLLLAMNHPDKVKALTLYSPTLWLSGRQVPWYVRFFRLVNYKPVANWFRFPVPSHVGIKDQRIRDFIRKSDRGQLTTPGGAVLERRRLASFVQRRLGRVSQPALIIHAREDDYAGIDNADFIQKTLSGPVDLAVLDDCYHMVTVDKQRHQVVSHTAGFVARIARAAAGALERSQPRPSANAA